MSVEMDPHLSPQLPTSPCDDHMHIMDPSSGGGGSREREVVGPDPPPPLTYLLTLNPLEKTSRSIPAKSISRTVTAWNIAYIPETISYGCTELSDCGIRCKKRRRRIILTGSTRKQNTYKGQLWVSIAHDA